MITEDQVFFDKKWRDWEMNLFKNEYDCEWCNNICCFCCSTHDRKVKLCFNPLYLSRFLLRMLDFAYRVSLILLLWLMVGGFSLSIYLLLEWVALIIIAVKAKRFVV